MCQSTRDSNFIDITSEMWLIQNFVFGLGVSLFEAGNHTLRDDEEPEFSASLQQLLEHMTAERQAYRLSVAEVTSV